MGEDKEALERLKQALADRMIASTDDRCNLMARVRQADLSWLIAEREGLEREVATLRAIIKDAEDLVNDHVEEIYRFAAERDRAPLDPSSPVGSQAGVELIDQPPENFGTAHTKPTGPDVQPATLGGGEANAHSDGLGHEAILAPSAVPVQDVVGLQPGDLAWLGEALSAALSDPAETRDHAFLQERVNRICAALSVAPPSQGTETRELLHGIVAFEDPERLEYVAWDAPVVHRTITPSFDLLLDVQTREPVGFTFYGRWPAAQPHPDESGLVESLKREAIGWAVVDLCFDEPTINTGALDRRFDRTLAAFHKGGA